jgi:putative tricarboxylic transport membrane protein
MKPFGRLGRDGIAGLIFIGVSLVLLGQAFRLPQLPFVPVGPGFYPKIILVFLAIVSAMLVAQDLRSAPVVEKRVGTPAYDLVAAAFAISGAYILLLPMFGYRIATVAFVAALQSLLERPKTARQTLLIAAIAVATSAATYLLFERYLSVLLPRGTWTNW